MAEQKAGLKASVYDTSTMGTGNPFTPISVPSGLSELRAGIADIDSVRQRSLKNISDMVAPQHVDYGPNVMFSPSTNQMFVNGALYDVEDAQSALDVKNSDFLDRPPAAPPANVPDWQVVSPEVYFEYINNIEDPSIASLMARNFEIGGSNLKLLAGRGLQFFGAEKTGQDWVDKAATELFYNQPYQREFTSIELGDERHGFIDWFAANLAQQGPNLIESVIVALIGAGAGAIAGGGANPFTAVGGAIMSLMGKQSFKQAVLAAAKKYMKGQPLTAGEKKLLREVSGLTAQAMQRNPGAFFGNLSGQALTRGQLSREMIKDAWLKGAKRASAAGKTQAMAGGAAGGSLLGSYLFGIGDIYGEARETGVGGRLSTALWAIPYAAAETIPEFFLAGRIFGNSPKAFTSGRLPTRVGKGFAVGGTLEGLTELAQEGILLTSTNQIGDKEMGKRLINAFAAGFGVGGPIGSLSNIRKVAEGRGSVNLLDDSNNPDPTSTTQPVDPDNPDASPISSTTFTGETAGADAPRPTGINPVNMARAQALINERPDLLTMSDSEFNIRANGLSAMYAGVQPIPAELVDTLRQMRAQYKGPSQATEQQLELDVGPTQEEMFPQQNLGQLPPVNVIRDPNTGQIIDGSTVGTQALSDEDIQRINPVAQQQPAEQQLDLNLQPPPIGPVIDRSQQDTALANALKQANDKSKRDREYQLALQQQLEQKQNQLLEARNKLLNMKLEAEIRNIENDLRTFEQAEEDRGRSDAINRDQGINQEQLSFAGIPAGETYGGKLQRRRQPVEDLSLEDEQTQERKEFEARQKALESLGQLSLFDLMKGKKPSLLTGRKKVEAYKLSKEENDALIAQLLPEFAQVDGALEYVPKGKPNPVLDKKYKTEREEEATRLVIDSNLNNTLKQTMAIQWSDMKTKEDVDAWFELMYKYIGEQGEQDAIQKQSPAEVDAQEQAGTSPAVGARDEGIETAGTTTEQVEFREEKAGPVEQEQPNIEEDTGGRQVNYEQVQESIDSERQANLNIAISNLKAIQASDLAIKEYKDAYNQATTDMERDSILREIESIVNPEGQYGSFQEAWEDMSLPGTVDMDGNVIIPYDRMPQLQREAFEQMKNTNSVTYEKTKALFEEAKSDPIGLNLTEKEKLNIAMAVFSTVDPKVDIDIFLDAAEAILNYAFFNSDSNLRKQGIVDTALGYINSTQFTEAQQMALDQTLTTEINIRNTITEDEKKQGLEAGIKNSQEKDKDGNTIPNSYQPKPWLTYMKQRGLLDTIIDPKRLRMIPQWFKEWQDEQTAAVVATDIQEDVGPKSVEEQMFDQVEDDVSKGQDFINNLLDEKISQHIGDRSIVKIRKRQDSIELSYIENLYSEANPDFIMERGVKLKDFFSENGELNLIQGLNGNMVPVTTKYLETQAEKKELNKRLAAKKKFEAEQKIKDDLQYEKDQLHAKETKDNRTVDSVFDEIDSSIEDKPFVDKPAITPKTRKLIDRLKAKAKEQGNFYRVDTNEPITNPVPKGKIELIVSQVVRKLKSKPTVTVVSNPAELERANPALFARAVAGRGAAKDFTTTKAAGYSVGDQIIIFSDFIRTEEQARFVIAHETLGHFGFRAFVPRARLNTIFKDIYNTESHIKAVVDRKVDAGMDFFEAVEETLADTAASIDASLVTRFWYAVRNFLNKFGKTFDDDMSRYLISQSRRNLRTGGRGVVSARQMAKNLAVLANESKYGRFSVEADRANLASVLFSQMGSTRNTGPYSGFTGLLELAKKLPRTTAEGDLKLWLGELLEEFQTLDNVATKSDGLSRFFRVFQDQQGKVKRLHAIYHELTAYSHTANLGFNDAPTASELEQAGELLAYAALYKGRQATDQVLKSAPDLAVNDANGNIVINPSVFTQLKALGSVSKAEFMQGIPVTLNVAPADGSARSFNYVPQFEITDNVWKIFTQQREAINESALHLLEANMAASFEQKQEALNTFKSIMVEAGEGGVSSADILAATETLNKVMVEYFRLYKEGGNQTSTGFEETQQAKANAKDFIEAVNRAMHERRKLDDWAAGRENTAAFQEPRYAEIKEGLARLNSIFNNKEQSAYAITNIIRNLVALDTRSTNAELMAKRTIVGAYVPFTRRGDFQVLVKAYKQDGKLVDMDEVYKTSMPYYQVGTREDARIIQDSLNKDFSNQTFKILDRDKNEQTVTFRAEFGKARQSQPVTDSVNINEVMELLQRLDPHSVKPELRESLIKTLTKQGDRARNSLDRSGVLGWDKDVVRSISQYLESQGHIAGKTQYRHRVNNLMLDDSLWRGDRSKLAQLMATMQAAEQSGNPERIKTAQYEYDRYAYMYQHMADVGNEVMIFKTNFLTGKRTGTMTKTKGLGENAREKAKRLLAWYADSSNIDVSTEDILSGEVGSRFKLFAVLFQLGGSVATAFINAVSMVSHSIPYLATYNSKRGFGGGFGFDKAAWAMSRASYSTWNAKLSTFEYMNKVANDESLQRKHHLSQDEAEAMRNATAEGVLQAAQFNALAGTARGGVKTNRGQAAIKAWMWMFSYTEQMNRRTTFLAAYRLERDRVLASGESLANAEVAAAEFGRKAVNTSQGEYAMYNRPEMARGNVLQYVFMYKQFVIVSVQLMKGLSPSGRIAMLGMLLLMSGLKGVPFADDLMDLIDTLLQRFPELKTASSEKWLMEFIDGVAPGWTPIAMRGFLDRFTGATISTRLGFGDLVPLSGALKAGADPFREVENFAGPVYAGIKGLLGTAGQLARYGAEAIGFRDNTTRFSDILRESPVSALRGVADAYRFHADGAITNSSGKVVSNQVDIWDKVFRAMAFYPSVATVSNDIVRVSKETATYVKGLKSQYTMAWVKAMIGKDIGEARRIERMILEWNRDTRNTEFEFRNFYSTANRSLRAAKEPTVLRYKRFAPKNIRPETQHLMDIYGLNDDL